MKFRLPDLVLGSPVAVTLLVFPCFKMAAQKKDPPLILSHRKLILAALSCLNVDLIQFLPHNISSLPFMK